MRLLDLFCGGGGAAMGYHRAGFEITGVDIEPQPRYPFKFIQADALEYLAAHGREFDAIHASPPCQAYSISRNNGSNKAAPRLIAPTRAALVSIEKPYIIENVVGSDLIFPVLLCGASFGLGVAGMDLPRHRLFESSVRLFGLPCQHRRGKTIGVYGHGTNRWHLDAIGRCILEKEKREAMGIDWMNRQELKQAIPPAYTEYLGKQLINAIRSEVAHAA